MFGIKIYRLWTGAALALCLTCTGWARANEDLYRKVAPSTVLIYRNEGNVRKGSGTGFLIDVQERLVVTARHVVEGTKGGLATDIVALFAQSKDGEIVTEIKHYQANYNQHAIRARVVYDSVRRDMAVLQLERLPAGSRALELASARARPGQLVHFIGNSTERFGCVFSYCQGHVRNAFRWEEMGANVVATQAPTNKGDSGGPMLNNLGEVVGFAIMGTTGTALPKSSAFHDVQVTGLSMCVTEMREALQEMRQGGLAKKEAPVKLDARDIKASIHTVMMEKDHVYRITITADGFEPDLRVDNNILNPTSIGKGHEYFFTPKETKDHRVQVGHFPGKSIGKGSLPYSLNIEMGQFQSEPTVKEALKTNEHVRKMEAGKSYQIVVQSKGFHPELQVLDGTKSVASKFFLDDNRGVKEFNSTLVFTPTRTADYRILVAIGPMSPSVKGPLDYVLQVAENKSVYSANDQITPKEPRKVHNVKLEAGKNYLIDLSTTQFDSRMVLEDGNGKELKKGTDFGAFSAQMFFTPTKTDIYRIVADSHGQNVTGQFSITVIEVVGPPSMPQDGKK